ncbi:hypothetical protein Dimus_035288, partial [Dionaea muscipula]
GRGSATTVEDSCSDGELGEGDGRFPGLSDSIEIRRLRVSELADSEMPGGRRPVSMVSLSLMSSVYPAPPLAGGGDGSGVVPQRDDGGSVVGCDGGFVVDSEGGSPRVVVDAVMDGMGSSSVVGGVAVVGLGGVASPSVDEGGSASVVGGVSLPNCLSSPLDGIVIPVQVSPSAVDDPSAWRRSTHSPRPGLGSARVESSSGAVHLKPVSATIPAGGSTSATHVEATAKQDFVNKNAAVPDVPASGRAYGPIPAGRTSATRLAGGTSSSRTVGDAAM